jgi:hypothetical protein
VSTLKNGFKPFEFGSDLEHFLDQHRGQFQYRWYPKAETLRIFSINGTVTTVPKECGAERQGIELYFSGNPDIREDVDHVHFYGLWHQQKGFEKRWQELMNSQNVNLIALVPKGIEMSLGEATGLVRIGDVEGNLQFNGSVGTVASIGQMNDLRLDLSGGYLATVKAPVRYLYAFLRDHTKLSVIGEYTEDINATLHNGSTIDLMCASEMLNLYLANQTKARIWTDGRPQSYRGMLHITEPIGN